jgi:hypothetical protein
LIRRVSVEASETHNAEGELTHASVTSRRRGKGEREIRVSEDNVEYLTKDDMD